MGLHTHGTGWRLVSGALLAMLVAVGFGCDLLAQSPYRKALPDTASDIREHRSGVVDFTYLLRAKITAAEFQEYVKKLGLVQKGNCGQENLRAVDQDKPRDYDPAWWSPIGGLSCVHGLLEDGDSISAKYENGFVYLSVFHL